jgi:hypothetical protein
LNLPGSNIPTISPASRALGLSVSANIADVIYIENNNINTKGID